MIINLSGLFVVILVACLSALLAGPAMIWFTRKIKLVDFPGVALHKKHQDELPLAGGLVISISLVVTLVSLQPEFTNEVLGILLGTLAMMIWGIVDDRFNLTASQKIFGQLLVSIITIALGVQVHITRVEWLDLTITLLWFVGLTNAFNFVDSMDGLAVGLAGIASAFFMMVTLDSSQPELAFLAAVLFGAMIGCFFYNAPPARMFLGDSGSLSLGFALAAIGIAYTPAQAGLPQGISWFIPILVLGVPIFDMALVIVSRLRQKRPIYLASSDHVYHRLVRVGFTPNRAVAAMQVVAILLSLVAFISLSTNVLIANLIFGGIVSSALIALLYLETKVRPG
ncbi:MAG: MraY family glycosyltransferase [Anaerolineales bacterium]